MVISGMAPSRFAESTRCADDPSTVARRQGRDGRLDVSDEGFDLVLAAGPTRPETARSPSTRCRRASPTTWRRVMTSRSRSLSGRSPPTTAEPWSQTPRMASPSAACSTSSAPVVVASSLLASSMTGVSHLDDRAALTQGVRHREPHGVGQRRVPESGSCRGEERCELDVRTDGSRGARRAGLRWRGVSPLCG